MNALAVLSPELRDAILTAYRAWRKREEQRTQQLALKVGS